MDQPGKVANPARGQLNRENNIPLSPCVPENLVVLIVCSCGLKSTTKNIIIYERIIAFLTSKIKVLYI